MKDEEFDKLLRDAARTYHRPPELADTDATWRAIACQVASASASSGGRL